MFGGLKARTWTPELGYSADAAYNADANANAFALRTPTRHDDYDPLNVHAWHWWVLTRATLTQRNTSTISLAGVQRLGGDPIAYPALAGRIGEVFAAQT